MKVIGAGLALLGMLGAHAAYAQSAAEPVPQVFGDMKASEDLINIPGTRWLIVSQRDMRPETPGRLELVDTETGSTQQFYPNDAAQVRFDKRTYSTCPGQPPQQLNPHGMTIRKGRNGVHQLYAVNHGERESVEVFEIRANGTTPKITWIGCVLTPDGLMGNSVAPLPEGFVMTQTTLPARGQVAAWIAKLNARESVGELLAWNPRQGWQKVDTAGADVMPNGIETSADGKWIYYADSEAQSFIRLSLGRTPVQKDVVELGYHTDNVHWAPDGSLLVGGQYGGPQQVVDCVMRGIEDRCGNSRVLRFDPNSLQYKEVFNSKGYLRNSGVAQVGDRIWLGAIRGTIASIPLRPNN